MILAIGMHKISKLFFTTIHQSAGLQSILSFPSLSRDIGGGNFDPDMLDGVPDGRSRRSGLTLSMVHLNLFLGRITLIK